MGLGFFFTDPSSWGSAFICYRSYKSRTCHPTLTEFSWSIDYVKFMIMSLSQKSIVCIDFAVQVSAKQFNLIGLDFIFYCSHRYCRWDTLMSSCTLYISILLALVFSSHDPLPSILSIVHHLHIFIFSETKLYKNNVWKIIYKNTSVRKRGFQWQFKFLIGQIKYKSFSEVT